MSYVVHLAPLALDDLVALHLWVEGEAGASVADSYLNRIEARVRSLVAFPSRGTPRDDLAPGIRTIAFERRIVIAYRIEGKTVLVLRIVSSARDLPRLFDES